jgi:hypothetical protein
MKQEREDFEAPEVPTPIRLSQGEQRAVYAEYKKGGADIHKLARYFDTTVAEVNHSIKQGELLKWDRPTKNKKN